MLFYPILHRFVDFLKYTNCSVLLPKCVGKSYDIFNIMFNIWKRKTSFSINIKVSTNTIYEEVKNALVYTDHDIQKIQHTVHNHPNRKISY